MRPFLMRRAEASAKKRKRLLLLSVLVELRDVGPEILGFLLVLDACEGHFGVGNLCLGVLDVVEELVLVPGDAGVLVGIGIAEAFHRAGLAAVEAVQHGADLVLGVLADRVAGEAFLERGLARGGILRQRTGSAGERGEHGNTLRVNVFMGYSF